MSRFKKTLQWIGGIVAGAAAVTAAWKISGKINYLEGEVEILKDQLDKSRRETIKTAAQQSYYNGRNAERATQNIEKSN